MVVIRSAALAILAAILIFPAFAAAQDAPGTTSNDPAFRRVSNRLLCQCGCGYLVLSCNHVDCPSATFLRRSVQTSLSAGKSEDAIVAGMIEQYGPRILPEPPKHGFSLSAWVMPFLVLFLGGALVSYVLWQWKFRHVPTTAGAPAEVLPEGSQPPQNTTSALVEKYRAQIDRDLENE